MFDVDVRRKSVVARRKYARRPKVYVSKVSMRIETKLRRDGNRTSRRGGEGREEKEERFEATDHPREIIGARYSLDNAGTLSV